MEVVAVSASGSGSSSGTSSSSSVIPSSSTMISSDRVEMLRQSVLLTMYTMVSRGLFEEHKLVYLTQITFRLLHENHFKSSHGYTPTGMQYFLKVPKVVMEDNPIEWLTLTQWQSLCFLSQEIREFEKLTSDFIESEARFREWYNSTTPEIEKLPLDWRDLEKTYFLKLQLIRVLRPDRVVNAIVQFITMILPYSSHYLNCDAQLNAFQILQDAYTQSSVFTPIYFILSPGTDVVSNMDQLAAHYQYKKGHDYHNISLGQGQEALTKVTIQDGTLNGHWVLLNNVHLMPVWLLELDKILENNIRAASSSSGAGSSNTANSNSNVHPKYRLFISSDPSDKIPISVLEKSIKLTNEPPSGLKANVKRAFCCFNKSYIDELEPRTRIILFGMCYFHAIMLERKKYKTIGFNRNYPFAMGDLTSSAIVLYNYMENAPSKVPWADLRYLFGEIMYGGHIVNDMDRLICITYLNFILNDDLFDEMVMFPYVDEAETNGNANTNSNNNSASSGGNSSDSNATLKIFHAPKVSYTFDRILEHIELQLVSDTSLAFGLHSNTEILFSTELSDKLISNMMTLNTLNLNNSKSCNSTGCSAGGSGGNSSGLGNDTGGTGNDANTTEQNHVETVVQDILETYREIHFDTNELLASTNENELRNFPYLNVLLQECTRMNYLISEMIKNLIELDLAFRGDLTMSEAMEQFQFYLQNDIVPKNWQSIAYPSLRSLSLWLVDLQKRIQQLQEWMNTPMDVPIVLWISGFFNPQSFLTAVMQTASKKNSFELDKLSITTDITKRTLDSLDAPSRDGQYVYGLYLQGARWDINTCVVEASVLKEMYSGMPIVNIRALMSFKREVSNVFECPVYRTETRGPTFVFNAQLRTKSSPNKWILGGVALLMEIPQ